MRISVAIAFLAFLSIGLLASAQENTTNANDRLSPTAGDIGPSLTGSGKKGYVPLWLSRTKLGDSRIFQSTAGDIGIGTTSPAVTLDVKGIVNSSTSFSLGGRAFAFGSFSKQNAFLGFSGNSTTTGFGDTASGYEALHSNTVGNGNTASGYQALAANTTGGGNTASGFDVLYFNTTGQYNTASGAIALSANTTGQFNTASGSGALSSSTTGDDNTAIGDDALYSNTTGQYNTASGSGALYYNTTGTLNTALGYQAGPDSHSTNLTNATAIGAGAVVGQSNALVLGGTGFYAVKVGIGTATPANVLTIAQGSGQAISDGWTTYSSQRWKTNIETLHDALAKIQQLRGVSYDVRGSGKHEMGVIAEEVGDVVPEIVSWDESGKEAQGVDYSRLTALLIEATKEQQVLIHKQQEQLNAQQLQIARLTSQVNAIQASLKTNSETDAQVRTAEVHLLKAGP